MALQGALEAEESLFGYKSLQIPHFVKKKKKKEFWVVFLGRLSLSSL